MMAVNAEPKNTSSPASVTEVTDCLTDKVKRDRTKKKTDHVERLLVSSDGPGNERNRPAMVWINLGNTYENAK